MPVVASAAAITGVIVALTLGTGTPANQSRSPTVVASSPQLPAPHATALPADPELSCAQAMLAGMSMRARIGQLFLLGLPADGAGQAGPIITGTAPAGVFLTGRGTGGATATARLTADIQGRGRTASGGAGMFTAVDQEGGQVQVLTGPGFATMPSAQIQGTWSPERLRSAASGWGRQLRSAGVNVELAPVADVVSPTLGAANAPIGHYNRGFGDDPPTVAIHAAAFVRGMHDAGVQSVVKHFPGLGRVRGNTDFTANVTDDTTTATDVDLEPFTSAVQAAPAWVMVSSAIYTKIDPGIPAVFSPTVIHILRDSAGFTGLIVSDDLGSAAQVASVPAGQRAVAFIAAGGDIALTAAPNTLAPMIDAVLSKTADPSFAALVTAAEMRVLTAKQHMGLLPCAPAPH